MPMSRAWRRRCSTSAGPISIAVAGGIDPQQIGIFGIGLGGITASLAGAVEPRITNVCVLLAGGDFPTIAKESARFPPRAGKIQSRGARRDRL